MRTVIAALVTVVVALHGCAVDESGQVDSVRTRDRVRTYSPLSSIGQTDGWIPGYSEDGPYAVNTAGGAVIFIPFDGAESGEHVRSMSFRASGYAGALVDVYYSSGEPTDTIGSLQMKPQGDVWSTVTVDINDTVIDDGGLVWAEINAIGAGLLLGSFSVSFD